MKVKILIFFTVISVLLSGCSIIQSPETARKEIMNSSSVDNSDFEVKSVWIAYYELQKFTDGKDKNEFSESINSAFKELFNMGFNTVTVQVRPCADAFYKSKYFPCSKYCFGEQGCEMPYDPLEIMVESAHSNHLKIEAWINPYRVSQDGDINSLSEGNIAKEWYSEKSNNVYITDNGIFFNPASDEVVDLILNGVKEILESYAVDSIHFDDYFYPTVNEDIDVAEYEKYQSDGGVLALNDWRRERVSNMIKSVYSAIKAINKEVKFGISPAANIDNDYNKLYADVERWCREEGFIDYICPQIYFGFKNESLPFMQTVKKWISISERDLYIGLPLYKSGKADSYASINNQEAINEFVNNRNVISRQINYLRKIDFIKGIYVFSYDCLFSNECKEEVQNMLKALQDSSQS